MASPRPTRGSGGRESLTVLIADPDASSRARLRKALKAEGLVVVAGARDAESAVAGVVRERPQICLLDLELPGEGLSAIARVAKEAPETLIVVLTDSDRPDHLIAALTRGAAGYLLKGLNGERLAATLRAAYRGEPALSRSLVSHLIDEIRRGPARLLSLPDGPVMLTPREWDVGELLRDGFSSGEIAARLGVSPVTVRRHIGLLLRKLGVHDRETAVDMLRAYGRR
ncbi:MAG TPA: response regulator transcription factor [Gaiellaceae bacterium]|jgi:DNA-binding NarL/FixJ family response regulator|nr:response regulator transcription factor [Gaiellaceae bacterium]